MARPKKQTQELTEDQVRDLKMLQANFEMLERTKEEVKLRGSEEQYKRICVSQEEVIEKIKLIDPSQVKSLQTTKTKTSDVEAIMSDKDFGKQVSIDELLTEINKHTEDDAKQNENILVPDTSDRNLNVKRTAEVNNIDRNMAYDVIPLPSKGECYKEKIERLPVGFLTAYDENFITSPNLYQDGLVIDFLLKHKILNKDIDVDDLCSGDIDAITLFLRATSYGTEFPITVKDPDTRENIDTVVDLTTFKSKEFNLKGDKDGYFDFTLPVSKDTVKFKFLTRKDEKTLKLLSKLETNSMKAQTVKNNLEVLKQTIKTDGILRGKDKQYALKNLQELDVWVKKMQDDNSVMFSRNVTNRMELSIMAVNNNYDKDFIKKYIRNMPALDSLRLRQYIVENEPGINFEFEVERPESLGGGSFKTFLDWDDTIFLNFA